MTHPNSYQDHIASHTRREKETHRLVPCHKVSSFSLYKFEWLAFSMFYKLLPHLLLSWPIVLPNLRITFGGPYQLLHDPNLLFFFINKKSLLIQIHIFMIMHIICMCILKFLHNKNLYRIKALSKIKQSDFTPFG